MISRFDINNDGKKDILYNCLGYTGSCGYSWRILINKGNGNYELSKYIIGCVGDKLDFSNETYNGLRISYSSGDKVEYQ
jgi:hypothetical protein